MGHGLLHQSNTSRRIGAVLARSKDSHGLGEKVGVGAITLRGDARRDQADLLYLEVRRGTQVAQGRGLQNLHSWVRIPPAPPSFSNTYAHSASILLTKLLTESPACGFRESTRKRRDTAFAASASARCERCT